MKSINVVLVIICGIALLTCSEDNGVEPDNISLREPALELVKLEGGLHKYNSSTETLIDFGDIHSTSSQYFLLLNNGERDAFDINLSSEQIVIYPQHIDIISGTGSTVETLPIIQLTAVHVIPISGVGELLPLETGAFTDSIALSYKYVSINGDTVEVTNSYQSQGNKLAGNLGVYIDSVDVKTLPFWLFSGETDPIHGYPKVYLNVEGWGSITLSQMQLMNQGNVPINIEIWDRREIFGGSPLHDQTLLSGESFNLIDFRDPTQTTVWASNYLRISCGEYMLSFGGRTFIGGQIGAEVYILN